MPQHTISRKELKRDEFREGFVHGAEAVATHQKTAWTIAGIVLVIALGIFGWRFYTQRQTVMRTLRSERVEEFLADLRHVAKIVDNRKVLETANRRAAT